MTSLLTDTERYDEQITVYDTTDPWSPTVINGPVAQLANRTAWLRLQVETSVGWTALAAGVDFNKTISSTLGISLLRDLSEVLTVGGALRALDSAGVEFNDNNNQLSGYHEIAGLSSSVLDSRGRLYFNIVADGGGFYHINVYNRASLASSALVAHTASYNGTGVKTIIADNDSGLSGQITVDAVVGGDTDIYVEFFKWFVITNVSPTLILLVGKPLVVGVDRLLELWHGSRDRVLTERLYVPGSFATAASNTVLRSVAKRAFRWRNPNARFCQLHVNADALAATPAINARIDGVDQNSAGITLAAAQTWYTTTSLNSLATPAEPGSDLELTTTLGAAGDQDLSTELIFVLE